MGVRKARDRRAFQAVGDSGSFFLFDLRYERRTPSRVPALKDERPARGRAGLSRWGQSRSADTHTGTEATTAKHRTGIVRSSPHSQGYGGCLSMPAPSSLTGKRGTLAL